MEETFEAHTPFLPSLPSLSVVQLEVVSLLWLSVLLPCNLDLRANGVQWSLCAQPPGGGNMGKVDWIRNQPDTRICESRVGGELAGVWAGACVQCWVCGWWVVMR